MLPIALLSKKNLTSRLAFRHFQEYCIVAKALTQPQLPEGRYCLAHWPHPTVFLKMLRRRTALTPERRAATFRTF
jgi:hypothetical protein